MMTILKPIIAAAGVGVIFIGNSMAVTLLPEDPLCLECRIILSTEPLIYGECSTYNLKCCAPCQIKGELPELVCNSSNCSGETVKSLAGNCEEVSTNGCDNNECVTTSQLRCVKGYYGTAAYKRLSITECEGCTACPSSGGVAGTTSGPGAKTITECFIPAGTKSSDSSGAFEYTGNCYYKN